MLFRRPQKGLSGTSKLYISGGIALESFMPKILKLTESIQATGTTKNWITTVIQDGVLLVTATVNASPTVACTSWKTEADATGEKDVAT